MPILFGVVLLDMIGFGIVIPVLPFMAPQLGASKFDIALIVVTFAACAGLCGPFWGRLSDRIGRKPVIMLCMLGAALGYLLLGLATELWMIFAARAVAGLMAGSYGVASAMMADITGVGDRARGMGLIGAAFGLGLVLGPVLGGLLSTDGSFLLPCLLAGGMSLLAVVAAAVFLPESLSTAHRDEQRKARAEVGPESLWHMARRTGTRMLLLQYVLHSASVSAYTYLFPLWVGDLLAWGARDVGIVFGILGAIMALTQGVFMGQLVRLAGEIPMLRVCVALFLLSLLVAVPAQSLWPILFSVFVGMTCATLCMPVLNSLTTQLTPAPDRGRMMGTAASVSAFGRVLGPLIAGGLLVSLDYAAAWVFFSAVVAVYLLWALSLDARRAQDTAPESAAERTTT